MSGRRTWSVAWLVAAWTAGPGASAPGQDKPLSHYWPDEPPGALIRRLEPSAAPATRPAAGLTVRRECRFDARLGVLFIDVAATNGGKAPCRPDGPAAIDLAFRVAAGADDLHYRPLAYRNDTWYGSTYWSGPDWTRVGRNWHHPGTNTPSARRFQVPRDGRATISGRVRKADTNQGGGDGVRVSIRHNARTVWQADIDGSDSAGTEPGITLDVRKGDALRFVVHKRGLIFYDTTWWDPVVTYPDGERHQASESFSTDKQGRGGWFYEMQVDSASAPGLPTVYWFGRDAALRQAAPDARGAVRLDEASALSLAVVADGADGSGVVLAVLDGGAWRMESDLTTDGRLRVRVALGGPDAAKPLAPGESRRLGRVAVGVYRGTWAAGMTSLQRLAESQDALSGAAGLGRRFAEAFARGAPPHARVPDLDLWAMVQAEWRREDDLTDTPASHAAAAAKHVQKAARLLADLREGRPDSFLAAEADELKCLTSAVVPNAAGGTAGLDDARALYFRVRRLKRHIALANPLMGFGRLLFCKRVPTSYSHLVMQYFGWRARPGGGLFVLQRPGWSLAARDILNGALADGNVLEPRLSWDARRIVFSFVRCGAKPADPAGLHNDRDEGFYHVYEVGVDPGAPGGLRQLTRGPYDDVMPTYLPDGGVAFCSTRRKGYARCFGGQFGPRWHVYTLHRVDPDGRIGTLSFHDTNEWFPAVGEDGRILYSRWDYIDRDAVTHQNLWATRPDGTNPVALWGNATASPHCTFQAQPIPGTGKVVFTASAHHSIAGGSIAVVDPSAADNGEQAVTRITPEVPFPEAESRDIREYYAAPWPLADAATGRGAGVYFLVAYSPWPLVWEPGANRPDALGLYLLDAFGNRELLYRDARIGSTNPCPLSSRATPPVLAACDSLERSGEAQAAEATGEVVLADVYQGLGPVRRGTIRQIRIVQIFPKTTPLANQPPVGLAGEENARAILGTVPVEADGSARFLLPAGRPVLFQALDADGLAYQTMRSVTYVQPGERVSCVGCHEGRLTAPPARLAATMRREPSRIEPGEFGGRPFSYVRVVQPVLDRHCLKCHSPRNPKGPPKGIDLTGGPHKGFTRSYWSLCGEAALVPRFAARNQIQVTPPGGLYGALGSRLIRMLRKGHNDVKLSADELRRLAAWIDCNAIFYGVYGPEDQARQLGGEDLPMPDVQ